ncbi:MAG: AAA family ATPase [Leptospiraceae bacterium]|nr:AAA family ATPase [Leptospiraceae bacterium]MDW8305445.1 AAA family ATPase [Leptospiraceae bacterium]
MGKAVALANQKGGVGKTTTAINLAYSLSQIGKKILLVDMDPQGNAGSGLGFDVGKIKENVYFWLIDQKNFSECCHRTKWSNLEIVPANIDLAGFEVDMRDNNDRDYVLRDHLRPILPHYDFVLVDCPPSLGLLTINSLVACDSVLIPLQCEYFALEGLSQLLRIIKLVQSQLNTRLVLEGLLLTMYDSRTRLSAQVVADVRQHFKEQVYEVIIPRNVKLSEAPSFGEPVGVYDPDSSGALSYRQLAQEFLERQGA